MPRQTWSKTAQRGFVDLCHIHRKYHRPVPPSNEGLQVDICTVATTMIWAPAPAEVQILLGCDDPIRLFHNQALCFEDAGRCCPDPFRVFPVSIVLSEGLNYFTVIVGNTINTNWGWNGFSFHLEVGEKAPSLLHLH